MATTSSLSVFRESGRDKVGQGIGIIDKRGLYCYCRWDKVRGGGVSGTAGLCGRTGIMDMFCQTQFWSAQDE